MKRTLLFICSLLCANLLMAQTFKMGNVSYSVKYNTTDEVDVVDCDNVSLIIIPETVTYNGITYNVTAITGSLGMRNGNFSMYGAFEGCSNITSITLPNSITLIDKRAFYGCTSLASINIPNNVTLIEKRAFQNCSNLTSVIIGNGVTSIEDSAFYACQNLTSLELGESLERIEDYAFHGCDNLISVNIPNSVTSIGNNAFYSCDALTSIVIGSNVVSIGNYAFAYSNSLTSIVIGESVSNIGNSAFTNSIFSLQSVTCLATTPPTLANNDVFPYPNIATLTVPCGNLEVYSAPTSYWNVFFNGRITENGYNVVANADNNAWGSVTVENNCSTATLTATANACYQFVAWNDGNTENPRIVTLSSDTTLTATFEVMVVNNDITATICEGQVYNENGFEVSEAGTYTQTLQTANGCDSVVTLVVTTYPVFDTTITATINAGETYSEFGFNESEAGTYVQNLQTVNGCDSTITLILDVNSSLLDVEETELSFYPNPTDSKVIFNSMVERIEVIDQTGRCVLTFSNAREINIESLPAGAYYLRLTNNDKAIMRKVIKE